MPRKRGQTRIRKRKERGISKTNTQTCLYVDDDAEVLRRYRAGRGSNSKIIRELVSKALFIERMEQAGQDVTSQHVIRTQTGVVHEGITPLITSLNETKHLVEDSVRQMQQEYASIEERLKRIEHAFGFIIKALDRMLQNIVLIWSLIWVYVFEFYYTVLVSTGRSLTKEQLNRNYKDRVHDIRIKLTKYSLIEDVALESAVIMVVKNLRRDSADPPS
jgi:hypothetical protein